MIDTAICTKWNGEGIELPHCNARGCHLCGDWSIPLAGQADYSDYAKGNMERWFDGYLRRRLPKLGLTTDTTATLMMDLEVDSAAFRAYPSLVHAACKMMPRATIGVWTPSADDRLLQIPNMRDTMRMMHAAVMVQVYQQQVESPVDAQTDTYIRIERCVSLKENRGIQTIPVLSLGLGWQHQRYPKDEGADGTGPLATVANFLARREALSGLCEDYGIRQCVTWESARDADIMRAKALTGMSGKMRERVERMRGDEAGVPVATMVAT